MLTEKELQKVNEWLANFNREQQLWLSGYIAGLNGSNEKGLDANTPAPKVGKVTIAYGTETGNSKKIATQLATKAKQKKIVTKLVSLEQYKTDEFPKEEYFFAVVSTHGDGEPPAAAKNFHEFILASNQQFPNLKYSVLALGDSAYPLFCKAAADIDEKLNTLGAKRVSARRECDVDYESEANLWMDELLQTLVSGASANGNVPKNAPPKKPSGKIIYKGKINANINLNDVGSNKETHHIEIISADGKVDYQPGDSIGIIALNDEKEVNEVLHKLKTIGSNFVQYKDKQYTFAQLLRGVFSIRQLPARIVTKYAAAENISETINVPIDLVDLLEKFPPAKTLENPLLFLDILETITPRLYSIASSNDAHNDEVHICVAQDSFTKNNQKIGGLASKYLNNLAKGASVEFYIQRNNLFRLPDDE
ncbi:MAG TPA: flavodoxin domain-containing protein, partial [Chitinophagales bacterium]